MEAARRAGLTQITFATQSAGAGRDAVAPGGAAARLAAARRAGAAAVAAVAAVRRAGRPCAARSTARACCARERVPRAGDRGRQRGRRRRGQDAGGDGHRASTCSARGIAAGVVSRGYGRSDRRLPRGARRQRRRATWATSPLLIRALDRRAGVRGARGASRRRAPCSRAHPDTQVIVSDDGLQHHALARDIEICVFDERGVGNGWLLPAGPLREPWPRHVRPGAAHRRSRRHRRASPRERALADHAVRARRHAGRRSTALRGQPLHGRGRHRASPRPSSTCCASAACALAAMHRPARPPRFRATGTAAGRAAARCCAPKRTRSSCGARQPDAWAVPLRADRAAFWQAFDRAARTRSYHRSHGHQAA